MTGEAVATVAGAPITVADLERRVAALRVGPLAERLPVHGSAEDRRLRRWVVQTLVAEAVVAHEAGAAGLPPGPPADAARRLFERVTADVGVPEAAVRSYYEANRDRFRRRESRRVRHLLLSDRAAAARVAQDVAAGDDMAALARRLSEDSGSRERGGDLGPVRRGELAGAFEDAAFAAALWAVVGPVRTEFGWHVLRVEEVAPEAVEAYEAVSAGIAADLLAAARGRAFDAWLAQRRRVVATVARAWAHPGDPSLPDAVHRH